jgi:hypothetical protein
MAAVAQSNAAKTEIIKPSLATMEKISSARRSA